VCWMCVEPSASLYRKCDGCKELKELDQLQKYDIFERWGELAEFVNQKRIVVFCRNCVEEMDKYRDDLVKQKPRTAIMIPENGMPVSRSIDRSHGTVPVGVHCIARQETLGIRCAKQKYGINAVEEILQGFVYHDDLGHQIKRMTLEDVDETTRCDKCWLPLWQCNAEEVTR
jgi:hypothetical protein